MTGDNSFKSLKKETYAGKRLKLTSNEVTILNEMAEKALICIFQMGEGKREALSIASFPSQNWY